MPEEDQRRTGFPRGQEATATCVSVRSKGSKGSKGSMSIVKEASVACYERENWFHESNWSKSVSSSSTVFVKLSRALPCLQFGLRRRWPREKKQQFLDKK